MGFTDDRWQRWTWGSPPAQGNADGIGAGCGAVVAVLAAGAVLTAIIWFLTKLGEPDPPPDIDGAVFHGTWVLEDVSAEDVGWQPADAGTATFTAEFFAGFDQSLVGRVDLGSCVLELDEEVSVVDGESSRRTDASIELSVELRPVGGGPCPQVTTASVSRNTGSLDFSASYGSYSGSDGLRARITKVG